VIVQTTSIFKNLPRRPFLPVQNSFDYAHVTCVFQKSLEASVNKHFFQERFQENYLAVRSVPAHTSVEASILRRW
jgi:hypothetical protein